MSSFLRKASLSKKKKTLDNEDGSPRAPSVRGDKPPRSRNVSEAESLTENGDEGGKPKRKVSLGGKSRKRLSSLFSSSSLSSYTNDKESTSSPKRSSNLNHSTTANSSGASTPTTISLAPGSVSSERYSGLNGKGVPGDANGVKESLAALNLGAVTNSPVISDSPEASPTAVGAPVQPVSAGSSPDIRPGRQRTASLYSQWDLEEVGIESDDEEDFLSASEGLSDLEEEEEPEEPKPQQQILQQEQPTQSSTAPITPAVANAAANTPTVVHNEPTNVQKGSKAEVGDISGTGASTIKRHVMSSETKVKRGAPQPRPSPLTVDQAAVLPEDIEKNRVAIALFLTSRMKEAEASCAEKDGEGHRLYLQNAVGILESLKGMMTFDSVDLANALEICKSTTSTASLLRRPADSMVSRLGGLVKSGAGLARVKAMSALERHAELVYAEQSLLKALLAIVSGGDWLGLVREALNMRTAHGIYRTLQLFLEDADKHGYDDDIDMDFRSGVLLGTGTSSLMLSLLPAKVLKIAEVFGYGGDRKVALATLMSAGGWSSGSPDPAFDEENEGLRRPVCDLILLVFHLVISVLMPITGTDVPLAKNILAYNMKRYPNGVLFLYFQARLHTTMCQPAEANESLQRALDLELEYIQLQHMCLWDYACNHLMLGNFKGALDCFSILRQESNWSRAVYTYAAATCVIELNQDGDQDAKIDEAEKLMLQIPKLTKKIAGKSLPIEKLCSRKARKFQSQHNRLFLPALELAYVFGSLANTPRKLLLHTHLPRIEKMLERLVQTAPEEYGPGYWDDYCLGHFLKGMCQATARYQPPEAAPEAKRVEPNDPSDEVLDQGAEKDYQAVIRHSHDVQLDHYILFHNYYELGRLYARRGDDEQAKRCFEVIMTSKLPEHNAAMAKAHGKYSLEGALMLKTHAALSAIKEKK
ncbi:hypothetical protein CI109_100271 [Kwoniella shandongensis]|uniref:Uncharacterized protein n=1 Tax=Kwoniella shandongensis TaxID=1734106 RepID=A0A5M6C4C6_9TREE|nr:uncharacterized protein CI109_001884 [Kwoniella shandongensis]KAA5529944.1 hypothetical protein CI109_001884 [Kwoniella shandongensis]